MSDRALRVLVVHGPNLNMLGSREPEVYGATTLEELDAALGERAAQLGLVVRCEQANGEGALVDLIQSVRGAHDALILNPGGYTHTSVAIADALRALDEPVIEVHLSNLYARESFRHTSVTGTAATGVIMGLGPDSYLAALEHLARIQRGR